MEITSGQPVEGFTQASDFSRDSHMEMQKKITRKKSLLDLTKREYSLLEDEKDKKVVLKKKRKLEEDIRALEKAYDDSVTKVARLVNQEAVVSTTEGVADVTSKDIEKQQRTVTTNGHNLKTT